MRSSKAGKVCDRLWYLGRKESGIYLIEGEKDSLVITGGMSYLAPLVVEQLSAFGIEEKMIVKMLILHAHFDHVGLFPFFKRRNPAIELCASARAWEILGMPKGIETINAFSRLVAERMGMSESPPGRDLEWRDDLSGTAVSEGDQIDLGGLTVRILETPGHSSCSISAYVPELRALFPSDGGGIPYAGTILPAGNSDYTKYQESLRKLEPLEVDILCADHYGYVTGREAREYITRSITAAAEERSLIEAIYRRTGSIEETAAELTAGVYKRGPDYFLAPEIYAGVCRQTVRHIARALETPV